MELFKRCADNPILSPDPSHSWESRAVFNPAVVVKDGSFHMLYRAIGDDRNYVSRIGLATSEDGILFERSEIPWLVPSTPQDRWGAEDPRATVIGDTVYVTYTAISEPVKETEKVTRSNPLVATVALVTTTDFSVFSRQGLISPDYSDNKDTVLFPEQINDCYVMLHRPHRWSKLWFHEQGWTDRTSVPSYVNDLPDLPSIWISYSKDLITWFDHAVVMEPVHSTAEKIGSGAPPLKTDEGWLLIYHHVHKDKDGERIYSARMALLDLDDPSRVIARTETSVLTPSESYELKGDVANVVFPTGACIRDELVYLYYGAADTHCALATAPLSDLLAALR